MRRTTSTAVLTAVGVVLLSGCVGCTAAGVDDADTVAAPTVTTTVTTRATPSDTGPVVAGPTTTAEGSCPFLTLDQALDDVGERLGRVTVATSGGAPVGCTFYPASGALASSEHLPPPDVPVIGVTLTRYADADAAHNAMVLVSRVDPGAFSDPAPGTDEAVAFATSFYAEDGDDDRAYAFRKGTTLVLVQVAQTSSLSAKRVGADVAATLR